MRIGELLRERGWVEPTSLDRAIAEQRHTGKRLCSMLVARGLLDADEAARALGAQHGVAAALQRHLENRDTKLVRILPPELARSCVALPLGRGRGGELIVCVRDPSPELQMALAQATGSAILLAVAPATHLERLVEQAYGPTDSNEFDVDLTTGPIDILPDELIARSQATQAAPSDPSEMIDLGALTLVGLDDERVAKDHNASGQFAMPRAMTPGSLTPVPVSPFAQGTSPPARAINMAVAAASQAKARSIENLVGKLAESVKPAPVAAPAPPVAVAPPKAVPIPMPSLDETLVKLERATTRDGATDVAMAFVTGRWTAALLLTIKEGVALGHRGHGGQLSEDAVQAVTVPLATTSIVRSAHDARKLVTEGPAKGGAIQDRLARLLGTPKTPAAAPILVGQRVACVLVVGDVRDRDNATTDMTLDLDDLAVALGSAYARILRDAKRV